MRVLVTGAGGFVGCHLLRALLAEGHELFAAPAMGAAPPPGLEAARWLPLELESPDSVRALVREAAPERVFHLAARSSVGESFADPVGTWETNAMGTVRLLDALPEGTRVLVVGSAEVYGIVPGEAQPIREDRPLRPASPYAASKAAAEMAAVEAALSGRVHAVATRSFSHTGPGQTPRFALASFARQLAAIRAGEAEPVLRVGNLEARRDYLDVRDVVRAYLLLVERGAAGGVYNVGSGGAHSLRELLDELVRIAGVEVRVETDPELVRPVDLPLLCGDASALRALGWEPEYDLRRTLADLLEWAAREAGWEAQAAR